MMDDVHAGRSAVLEAHGRYQINEESIASLSEQCILIDQTPNDQNKHIICSKHKEANREIKHNY